MDARIILIALTSQSLRKRKKTKTEKRTRISGMLRGVQFSPKIYGGVLFFCVLGLLHLGMTVGYNGVIYGIGLDYGTSGARVCVADNTRERNIIFSKSHPWEDSNDIENPSRWIEALNDLLVSIPDDIRNNIGRICVSGTSSTCLLVDKESHKPSRGKGDQEEAVKLYNWDGTKNPYGQRVIEIIKRHAPSSMHSTLAPSSTLVKLLTWHMEKPIAENEQLFHQADYIASYLLSDADADIDADKIDQHSAKTDWNNALKLGYDVHSLKWPTWIKKNLFQDHEINLLSDGVLPSIVLEPGDPFGKLNLSKCKKYNFPLENNIEVVAGTTDSIAAFIACGPEEEGEAVTSLGSTLAIKMLSKTPIEDVQKGVYSHRYGDNLWLVGGASNVGCQILREERFSDEEMINLTNSNDFDPTIDSLFEYIPLVGTNGERFPICDPHMKPCVDPKPKKKDNNNNNNNDNSNSTDDIDRVEYFKALLQGISRTEKKGYDVLVELGACQVKQIFTAGGGGKNLKWIQMRERLLQVPILSIPSAKTEASYGAAKLALKRTPYLASSTQREKSLSSSIEINEVKS